MTIDTGLIAAHGAMLSAAASLVIMGSLRCNPRLFLRHFPPAVREAQAPLSPGEKAVGRIVALFLMALFVGGPIASASLSAGQHRLTRIDIFLHAFLVGMTFNLVDWLLLDEVWLGRGRPRWALPPGVTPDEVPWSHMQHFRGFLSGSILFLVVAGAAALFVQAR